jgi:Flp pilus assembly pilin Flp
MAEVTALEYALIAGAIVTILAAFMAGIGDAIHGMFVAVANLM